jgi:uncharacterized protein YqeY
MTLLERLNNDLKDALRARDETRKLALRQVLAGVKQAALEKRTAAASTARRGQGSELTEAQLAELDKTTLEDSEVVTVLQKEAKTCREAAADAQRAGRRDLVAANEAELRLIEGYLPEPLTREALVELARAAIAEAGVSEPKGVGAVMKLLTPRTKGRADGKLVSDIVRELLTHS